MSERKYSVREIDDLRWACERKYLWGSYSRQLVGISRAYREDEMRKVVEEMVRTHMIAGHTADDLRASDPRPPLTPHSETDAS